MAAVERQKIVPCLWFDGDGEAAAEFYVSLFPDSRIDEVTRAASDYPAGKEGDVLTVELTLAGRQLTILNGGPHFKLSEAASLQVDCEDQAEVDRLWDALSAVPEAEQCGWIKDRWGVSWQIVPSALPRLLSTGTAEQRRRVMQAMLEMKKLDVAGLEAAARG